MAPADEEWAEEPRATDEFTCVDIEEFDALSITPKPKPVEKYPAKLHARAVAKHLNLKKGLILLPSRKSSNYEDSDQGVFFRQNRYFYYMTGVDLPDCTVTYNVGRDRLVLFIPPPTTGISVVFNGTSPTPEEILAKYDFDHVAPSPELNNCLSYYVHREKALIYVLHSYQIPKEGIAQTFTFSDGSQSSLYASPWDTIKLQPAMDAARVIKSPYELKMIRKANAISAQAHTNVLRNIKQLTNETEVEAIFAGTCIAQHAKRQAYGIIAGSGENASTLHYVANNEPLKGRQLMCLDAGCEWDLYAADVTRTFPLSGAFTPEAKEIYDIVAQMQEECIEMCKPGVNFRAIHMHAHLIATTGLIKLGVLHNGAPMEIYRSGASVAFFPHGLGHYLGLEVHDVGDGGNLLYPTDQKSWLAKFHQLLVDTGSYPSSVLAENSVITVEPGIYFSRYALGLFLKEPRYAQFINKDLLEKYYPVGGVRIEDDILITAEGYENLTTTPKGEDALRIINGEEEGEGKEDETEGRRRGWFY